QPAGGPGGAGRAERPTARGGGLPPHGGPARRRLPGGEGCGVPGRVRRGPDAEDRAAVPDRRARAHPLHVALFRLHRAARRACHGGRPAAGRDRRRGVEPPPATAEARHDRGGGRALLAPGGRDLGVPLPAALPGALTMGAQVRNRLIVWVALMALLALTVALTFAPLGGFRLAASLAIATA